ncbi:MAG: hypothetical protein GY926_16355 [bacterium]|nr:hypothetical protein [bacterium]
MIEPQNTTMPLPAEPAQVEAPQGDGIGFGEMLAQTLGATPAIDPNLVQRITADGHEQPDEELAGDPSAPDQGVVTVGRQVPTNRFVAVTPKETTPGIDPQVPAAGSGATPDAVVPPVGNGGPEQPLPSPAAPRGSVVPDKTPVDGLGKPVLTSAPPAGAGVEEQVAIDPAVLTPVDSVDLPVLTKAPEIPEPPVANPVDGPSPEPDVPQPVVLQPVAVDDQPRNPGLGSKTPTIPKQPNPTAQPAGPENIALGSQINTPVVPPNDQVRVAAEVLPQAVDGQGPAPARPNRNRQLPVTPTPTVVAEGAPAVETSSVPVTDPAPTPRMDLSPEVPVRLDDPKAVVPSTPMDAGPVVFEPTAPTAPIPVAGVEAAPAQATVTSEVVAAPIPHSALAERVLRAVELQANQPPPRTMVVDIPEIEGLRLVVSVRGGAQVHVVPTSGSPTSDGFQPFMNELNGVLSERGFVMTGDGRERGHNPNDPEQRLPTRLQRPTFRRPIRNDNDLRI